MATQETVVNGLSIRLEAPARLARGAALAGGETHDPEATMMRLVFANAAGAPLRLPFDEIRRGVWIVYRDPATGVSRRREWSPPPRRDGAVRTLAPGQTLEAPLMAEIPPETAPPSDEPVPVEICVRWAADWLRAEDYAPGAFDWNADFEVCATVEIAPDR